MDVATTDSEAICSVGMERPSGAHLLLAPLIAIGLASSALLFRPDFYLNDDARAYFWPIFEESSRLIRSGHLPFVTDRLWHGGAFLAEYQPGLLNPVSLCLITILGSMRNLAEASAIYSIFHLALLALGATVLCNQFGCRTRYSIVAGVVSATSEWILYFGAANWLPFVVSLAWAPWACAGLIKTYESRRWAPLASITIALVIFSGNTFTDLAIFMLLGVSGLVMLAPPVRDIRRVFATAAATICGALLSAPSVLPLLAALHGTGRGIEGWEWQTDLTSLLSFGVPYSTTIWTIFGGARRLVFLPMLGVAWFLPPVFANAPWGRLWPKRSVKVVLCTTLALAALSAGPPIWQFRWMFRLLPFYQFGLVILGALALSQSEEVRRRWSGAPTWLGVALPLWFAFWRAPGMQQLATSFAIIVIGLTFLAWWAQRRAVDPTRFAVLLLAGHSFVVVLVAATYSALPIRFPLTIDLPTVVARPSQVNGPTRFMVFPSGGVPGASERRVYGTFFAGNVSLEHPGTNINGYSDVWPAAYHRAFCLVYPGATDCPDIVKRLTTPIGPWGIDRLDLMRVDEVRFYYSAQAQEFACLEPDWRRVPSSTTDIFLRTKPLSQAAPVSWTSKGVSVVPRAASPDRIEMQVNNRRNLAGTILLARAWYPGWTASLAGKPLQLFSPDGIELAVAMPPAASGLMVISYWPEGLTSGLALAGLGGASVLVLALWPVTRTSQSRRKKKR